MSNDPEKVVLPRGHAVAVVIVERLVAGEADITVDTCAGPEQSDRFGIAPRYPKRPIYRTGRRQGRDGRRIVGGLSIGGQASIELCVGISVEKGYALAERVGTQRIAVDFAIADIDIDRDRVAELALEILNDGIYRGLERGRGTGDA